MKTDKIEITDSFKCFGGRVEYVRHVSLATNTPMTFAVFTPPQAKNGPVPAVLFLSGLTCTHENFITKAGAQRAAAELGLMLIAPDTSPRGGEVPDDPDAAFDFGLGAGFYVDATEAPWSKHYNMYSYIARELWPIVQAHFPMDAERLGICGHSMGGHGALVLGLRNPQRFKSISALAPITAPSQCPWGRKAFGRYLGEDRDNWALYDATEIMKTLDAAHPPKILIDQGEADPWLEAQLHPHLFEAACREADYPLDMRRHAGYEHGYYFVSTFIEDHLRHHLGILMS